MVQFRKLDMDGRKKEKIVFQNQMLHYGLYVPRPEAYFFGDIPWHWHDEFEFGHILGGSMQYKTNHHEFILHEGDGSSALSASPGTCGGCEAAVPVL